MPLKTIIVEDEPLSRAFLNNIIKEFFPEIEVVANEATVAGAVEAIAQLQPDLVFLDIELQTGTGFDVLQLTKSKPFKVIFTTALDHMAINLIRICGVDYLQKPIDVAGLREILEQVMQREREAACLALNHLMSALENKNRPGHIFLSIAGKKTYIPLADIVSIEAAGELARFMLRSGSAVQAEGTLKEFELLLGEFQFFRAHQHILVNLREIKDLVKEPESMLLMSNGNRLPLSPKKISALEHMLDNEH
jgi:two-component system LytT family response regulator